MQVRTLDVQALLIHTHCTPNRDQVHLKALQCSFSTQMSLLLVQEADRVPLYRVRFAAADIWEGNDADSKDTVDVEVYQPWLQAAAADALDQQQAKRCTSCLGSLENPKS